MTWRIVARYLQLAKPGMVAGNALTAAGGFLLASRGRVDPGALLAVVVGIALVVASGCVWNNYLDRDLDRRMARTRGRVLARGLIRPAAAARFGSLLGVIGVTTLLATTDLLAAAIVLGGFAVYVGAYTRLSKRRTLHSTLIGSLAGAAPPVAGYCAASGGFDAAAAILLAMFVLWQLPHFHAIAVFRHDDYAAAAVPVLPAVRGARRARLHIIAQVAAFVPVSLLLGLAGFVGQRYLAVVAGIGLVWLWVAVTGGHSADPRRWGRRLFALSLVTIASASVMMSVDATEPERSPSATGHRVDAGPGFAVSRRFEVLPDRSTP